MIVKWNGKGLLMTPIVEMETEEQRTRGGVPMVGGERQVRLIPGYNEVKDEDWVLMKSQLFNHIKEKKLEYFASTKKDETTGELVEKGVALRRQNVNKAREMVLDCFCLDSLLAWLKGGEGYEAEDRSDIRVLIEEQMNSINEGKPSRMIDEARKSLKLER